jgi:hypothetical protein
LQAVHMPSLATQRHPTDESFLFWNVAAWSNNNNNKRTTSDREVENDALSRTPHTVHSHDDIIRLHG